MKRFINFLFALLISVNLYAVSPSFLSGKTYLGEMIPEKGSKIAASAYLGEWKIMLKFKNTSQVEVITMLIPTGEHVDNFMQFFTGHKSSDLVDSTTFKYKIFGDSLILIGSDNSQSELMIVRNGEAIVISDGYEWGFTSALTLYKGR